MWIGHGRSLCGLYWSVMRKHRRHVLLSFAGIALVFTLFFLIGGKTSPSVASANSWSTQVGAGTAVPACASSTGPTCSSTGQGVSTITWDPPSWPYGSLYPFVNVGVSPVCVGAHLFINGAEVDTGLSGWNTYAWLDPGSAPCDVNVGNGLNYVLHGNPGETYNYEMHYMLMNPQSGGTEIVTPADMAPYDAEQSGTITMPQCAPPPPTIDNVTISPTPVSPNGASQYTIISQASDSATGITDEYVLINYDTPYRGALEWSTSGFAWWGGATESAPIACSGDGGWAAKYPGFGNEYINLLSCTSSVSGNSRTVAFTVTFNTNFTAPLTGNVLWGFAGNINSGLYDGWKQFQSFDLSGGWNGPVLTVGPINAQNVALGNSNRAFASASPWKIFADIFGKLAEAAGGPYANQPLKLDSTVTNHGEGTDTAFTNMFYIDVYNDDLALQPGVTTGWDLSYPVINNGISVNVTLPETATIRANSFNPSSVGLPVGSHGIVFCADVNGTVSNPTEPLSARCSAKMVQDTPAQPTAAPTAVLSANPTTVDNGQSSLLLWNSTNATSCTSAGGFATGGATSNETGVSVSPTTTTHYGITCTGPGGSTSAYATVTVTQPTVSITATPDRVTAGGSLVISWSASQVNSCIISGPGLSANTLSGSRSVTINTQSAYTITCQTNGAPVSRSITANIIPVFQEF